MGQATRFHKRRYNEKDILLKEAKTNFCRFLTSPHPVGDIVRSFALITLLSDNYSRAFAKLRPTRRLLDTQTGTAGIVWHLRSDAFPTSAGKPSGQPLHLSERGGHHPVRNGRAFPFRNEALLDVVNRQPPFFCESVYLFKCNGISEGILAPRAQKRHPTGRLGVR